MGYKAYPLWLLDPAKYTQEIMSAMNDFYTSWLPAHSSDDDLKLYHYTDLRGLKGILGSRAIWSSHSSTFNDPEELQYGKTLIVEQLESKKREITDKIILDMIEDLINYTNVYDTILYHNYVTCFCENGNLLSQWRGYANLGGGYSLGILLNSDTAYYHQAKNFNESSYMILRKVEYNPNKQNQWISGYIKKLIVAAESALSSFRRSPQGVPLTWASEAALQSVNILIELIISFKNPAFQEEAEWRLIKVKQADSKPELLHFREGNSGIVPYLQTHICKDQRKIEFPISEIVIGPLSEPRETKAFVELYVQNMGALDHPIELNALGVTISSAGYRIR